MCDNVKVWPPAEWCAAIDPTRTFICDQPRGHEGDHSGPEMPTVALDPSEDDCACVPYTIRTDYGTGIEHDVDRNSCPIHDPSEDA